MPVTKVIRYKTKPECADENERLIRSVFAELASDEARRAALRHPPSRRRRQLPPRRRPRRRRQPVDTSAAFAEFQSDIADRLAEGPSRPRPRRWAPTGCCPDDARRDRPAIGRLS